ncbi:MAG: hypothetical protein ACNS62_22250 [Candidatus Cyclobacteriaceae bacterium M3_2C_046]
MESTLPLDQLKAYTGISYGQWQKIHSAEDLYQLRNKLYNINLFIGLKYLFWRNFYVAGDIGTNQMHLIMDLVEEDQIWRSKANYGFFGTNLGVGLQAGLWDISIEMQHVASSEFGGLSDLTNHKQKLNLISLNLRYRIGWEY